MSNNITAKILIGILLLSFFLLFSNLEFVYQKHNDILRNIYYSVLFLLIMLVVSKVKNNSDGLLDLFYNYFLKTILLGFISFVLFVFYVFGGFCVYSISETIFIHKKDESKKIITRDYDCGALDGSPSSEFYLSNKHSNYFISYSEVDTNEIDRKNWVKIDY